MKSPNYFKENCKRFRTFAPQLVACFAYTVFLSPCVLKLFVPDGCKSVYGNAEQWMDFFYMEEGEGTLPHKGDVNSDGKVDKDDLRDLVDYIMGNKPDGVTEESADVNGDNKVNVADVVALTTQLK